MQLKTKLAGIVTGCALVGAIGCTPEIHYASQVTEENHLKDVLFSVADTNQDQRISTDEARTIALQCGFKGYFSKGVETRLKYEYDDYDRDVLVVLPLHKDAPYEQVVFSETAVKECFKQ